MAQRNVPLTFRRSIQLLVIYQLVTLASLTFDSAVKRQECSVGARGPGFKRDMNQKRSLQTTFVRHHYLGEAAGAVARKHNRT